MGKIMECGGICAVPKGRSMIATMRHDSFDLTPLGPEERCTPLSVASHTLYEKTRPDQLPGPGGVLSLVDARYDQVTEKTCRVSGAEFIRRPYQVKLEGVTHLGYRTIFIGGIRDPILISQIDDFLERVRQYTQGLFPELDQTDNCRLIYHVYGKNGVMGPLEPAQATPHEIAVLGEVVAPTQELSHTIANNARASILHFAYPGQMATTGNFASPLSPHEQEVGAVFKFSLYHLVDLQPGEEVSLFPITFHDIQSQNTPNPLPALSLQKLKALQHGKLLDVTYKDIPDGPAKLKEVARIIRSKNSGPFELTLDVMFDSQKAYDRVKNANILTSETIRSLYHVSDDDIITNMYFNPALAWKCTIKRPWAQGSVGERDTLGTQQHAPLLDIDVPASEVKANGASENTTGSIMLSGKTNNAPTLLDEQVNGGQCVKSAVTHANGAGYHTNGNAAHTNGTAAHTDSTVVHMNDAVSTRSIDRTQHNAASIAHELWCGMGLPENALEALSLPGDESDVPMLPSSFKLGRLAQSSIAVSALAAAQIHALRNQAKVPPVEVSLKHATIEFKSERLYKLAGKPAPNPWGPIGGLHKTSDGFVRIHDSFSNHRDGSLELLGLPLTASRSDVTNETMKWAAIDLESASVLESRLATYALRSYKQWDCLPQSRAISDFPISLTPIAPGPHGLPPDLTPGNDKCLRGLRVLEMSRVIAAPLAGKTLAAHGADVLWVTSPNLPDLPTMDRDFGRGKRTIQLDMNNATDFLHLKALIATADVFIQGFRPGALASRGLSPEDVARINPGIICANMSAFGPNGPWSERRGFDSLVQTCSGMNVSEAEHFGAGESARPTPCQALDHAGGYLLAAGILGALCRRASEGGSWRVDVSLAGCMKYLRSLGQYPGQSGFASRDYVCAEDVEEFLEKRESGFGLLEAVRHSANVEGCKVGWDIMPKELGRDEARWL